MKAFGVRAQVLMGVAALSAPHYVLAQTTDAPERGVLEEIVVTAQKRAESLQTVPIAVTAFSANQLTESNINGQIDLPKLTPNLNFTSNSGFASAYLRGVGTQFGNPGLEPSVSVYIDDTYIPRAGSAFFSLGDVNRIEVLKGPQGTLYGRNATGGAIRIITNDPTDKHEGKLEFTAGENGTRVYDGMLNVPLSEGIAVRFAASYDHNDGYVRNLNPGGDANGHRDGQNRDQQLYTAKLLMDRDGPWRFLLSADFSRKDDRESVSEANLFPGAPEQTGAALGGCVADGFYTYCNDGHDYLHTKAYGSTARLDYDAELFTLSSITGYRREYEYNCADIDATGAFVQPVCGAPTTKQITQEFQVVSNGEGAVQYVAGFFYLYEKSGYPFTASLPNTSTFPPTPTGLGIQSQGDNNKVDSWAPYAQVDWDFAPQWSVSLGARYTDEKKEITENQGYLVQVDPSTGFPQDGGIRIYSPTPCTASGQILCTDDGKTASFSEFTYKGTLSYEPTDGVLLYGTISRGFKSGGFNLPAFGFVDIVDPETLLDYELGWKMTFGRVQWNGAVFYYDYKDLQISITDQSTGGTRVENAASAKPKGIETDLTWLALDNLEVGIGGAYLDAQYEDFIGDAYFPCGQIASLPTPTPEAAAGVAAAAATCAGQGGLGLSIVSGLDLSDNKLINAPKYTGFLRAQYTIEAGNTGTFTVGGVANYRSKAYFDSANRFEDKSRTMFSARIGWTSADERYFASIFGENLTDKKYNSINSPQNTGGWRVPAPPRQIFGSVGVKF